MWIYVDKMKTKIGNFGYDYIENVIKDRNHAPIFGWHEVIDEDSTSWTISEIPLIKVLKKDYKAYVLCNGKMVNYGKSRDFSSKNPKSQNRIVQIHNQITQIKETLIEIEDLYKYKKKLYEEIAR